MFSDTDPVYLYIKFLQCIRRGFRNRALVSQGLGIETIYSNTLTRSVSWPQINQTSQVIHVPMTDLTGNKSNWLVYHPKSCLNRFSWPAGFVCVYNSRVQVYHPHATSWSLSPHTYHQVFPTLSAEDNKGLVGMGGRGIAHQTGELWCGEG